MIVLAVLTYNGAAAEPREARFDAVTGGTVGRGDSNRLVLPDVHRTISRVHARVSCRDGVFWLEDEGSNPIVINDSPLGKGRSAPLAIGDVVHIGGYVLQVRAGMADVASAPAAVAVAPPGTPAAPSIDDLFGLADDLLKVDANPRLASRVSAPRPPTPPVARTPLADSAPASAPAPAPAPAPAAGAGVSPSPAAAVPPPHDELLQAFLAGLGVEQGPQLAALTPELMRLVGRLLAESVGGTVDLLHARAVVKNEMRADVTAIQARENNPLKFSPTAAVALQHLLAPTVPGFLPAETAMRDAFQDLRAHELAVVAGMRSALTGLLRRFDPAMLETQLVLRTGLDALLAGGRRAQLWQAYQSLFSQLSVEAEDDFHTLFGRAFLEAYEERLSELKAGDRPLRS